MGVSIDGPQEFHDEYRKNKQGKPSFVKVMQGINLLKKHGVEWNGMAVVNDYNADYPLDFYNFFKEIGCHYIQFAPIVERIAPHGDGRHLASLADKEKSTQLADFSVTPEQWGDFLCALFDEWVKQDVGTYYIQLFDSTLANWIGEQPGVCSMAKTCGHAGVMEFNGDVYTCDHFVFPEYKLGNIHQNTLVEMMYGERQQAFGLMKQQSLPTQCRECEWLFACNGECPKNRFACTADGEPGLNYLCAGYHKFFSHVAPYMDFMKNELMNQRPPANIMEAIRNNAINHKPTSDDNEIQRHYLIIDYMKITFKKGLLAAIAALTVCSARADEGMWLLQLMKQQNSIDMMKKQGLKLEADDLYNPNGVSLKDAVGIFGGGCTGEIISPED